MTTTAIFTARPASGAWRRKVAVRRSRAWAATLAVMVALVAVARTWALHVAGMGSFVVAGFTVSPALGWVVAGAAALWTQHLTSGQG
jgi:hypothetical protein